MPTTKQLIAKAIKDEKEAIRYYNNILKFLKNKLGEKYYVSPMVEQIAGILTDEKRHLETLESFRGNY